MPGRIGILFSGIGFDKGTQALEIPFIYREIERVGYSIVCLVPREVAPIVGRGKITHRRDLFEECAPFFRGEAIAVEDADPKKINALIIPGGKGPITVLSDIAELGAEAHIVRPVQDLIVGMHVRGKPIGSLGYGGALLMLSLKRSAEEPIVTIGEDSVLLSSLSSLGIAPVNVGPQDVIFDQENKLFSAAGIGQFTSIVKGADSVERLTKAVLEFKEKKIRQTIK